MTAEVPNTIDLSHESAQQTIEEKLGIVQIGPLSPEQEQEREALSQYFETERTGLIHITQEELTAFKTTLGYENNHHRDRNEEIDEFMQEQILEWEDERISVSDIISQIWEFKESDVEMIETAARETLFGPEWVMKNLDLSEDARVSISTSLILAILQKLNSGETLTPEQLNMMSTQDMNTLFQTELQSLQALSATFSQREVVGPGIEKSKIDVSWNGDNNIIFSNILEGKNFFSRVIGWEINPGNLETEIESKNTQAWNPALEDDAAEILNLTRSDILGIMEKSWIEVPDPSPPPASWGAPWAAPEGVVVPPEIPTEVDKTLLEQWKESGNIFLQILATLFEAIWSYGKWMEESDTDSAEAPLSQWAIASEERDTHQEEENPGKILITFFNWLQEDFPANKENVIAELSWNSELSGKMIQALESISSDETIEVSFTHIFGNDRIDGIWSEIFRIFENADLFATLPEGTSEAQKILLLVEEYARYRNSVGVVGQTENRTTWEVYAQKRKQEWWSIDPTALEARR
jgi:hypothetical protein